MSRKPTRREFLTTSAVLAAGVGFWAAGGVSSSRAADKGPNDKVNIACIGVGGKGSSDTDHAGGNGNIVALCDIDDKHMEAKAAKFPQAKKYNDFRKMFDEMAKGIDAVTVSTPDHTHAPASVMAMKLGKHVYCQKPLTHTVKEARVMRETAAQMKVCTQMGNQGTAENGLRRAVELIQAGLLGQIKEIHVWTNRPVWPQSPTVRERLPKQDLPAHVHWEEFIGPAPMRDYNAGYHPFKWRGWWDFGTGALGDMACHTANMAFMACKLGYPTTVSAECEELNPETYPAWARCVFEFPKRDDMNACTLTWYEGKKDGKKVLPPDELLQKVLKEGQKLADSGSLLVGEKGILFSPNDYGAAYQLVGDGLDEAAKKVKETLPRNGKGDNGMKEEWVRAIMEGKPEIAMSNFNYAGMLTETILLGNVAMRAGKKLDWDGPNMKFTNNSDANKFLHFDYRKGWTL
jgi:predicted dehydrogenase